MLYLQRLDAGFLGIARLQVGDHASAVVAELPVLVQICAETGAHETAIAFQVWQFPFERRGQPAGHAAVIRLEPVRDGGDLGGCTIVGERLMHQL
ncbi:MAG: hypothetical protein P8Y36_02070, partial [Alphaproteobacteria bacterium]